MSICPLLNGVTLLSTNSFVTVALGQLRLHLETVLNQPIKDNPNNSFLGKSFHKKRYSLYSSSQPFDSLSLNALILSGGSRSKSGLYL